MATEIELQQVEDEIALYVSFAHQPGQSTTINLADLSTMHHRTDEWRMGDFIEKLHGRNGKVTIRGKAVPYTLLRTSPQLFTMIAISHAEQPSSDAIAVMALSVIVEAISSGRHHDVDDPFEVELPEYLKGLVLRGRTAVTRTSLEHVVQDIAYRSALQVESINRSGTAYIFRKIGVPD